jgi:RNA-directed DNA polymerase
LPFATQIKHKSGTPIQDGPLKAEVTFCVQGVASPLLANIYLHYVFDLWAARWRRYHAHGNVILVRYADDIVAGFEHQADARERLNKGWNWGKEA